MPHTELIRFASLRGHESAAAFLRKAAGDGCLAHSLMLSGSDGIGKRSLALAFAAWLQCSSRGEDSCGTCSGCRQVAAQTHPDLRLVSIASGKKEIGVDQARDLKHWISLRSAQGNTKIGILLDAEMLTVAAQNALLKTLEEPPAASILIVVTNNADALLPTVRSRCQRVPIRPLSTEVVAQLLVERHGVPRASAEDLARLAEGSPGRALALQDLLRDSNTSELLIELATHPSGRYVRLTKMAAALNTPESSTNVKLELLLAKYRDAALAAAASSPAALPALERGSSAVANMLSALRRTNPNRQLLLEALMLRLASTTDPKH